MGVRVIKIYDSKMDVKTGILTVTARLFASEKAAIKDGMSIEGLTDGKYVLRAGTEVYTQNGDIGNLGFDGQWHWIGESNS